MKFATHQEARPHLCILQAAYPECRALTALVDAFAVRMKQRLIEKWLEGKRGWDDPGLHCCDEAATNINVQRNLGQRDYVDVANLAALAWNRQDEGVASENTDGVSG